MKTTNAPRGGGGTPARVWVVVARALQATALLVVVLVVAAAWTFPPARLTPLVRAGLEKALGAPVALGQARLTLVPRPALELDDLVIGDAREFVRPAAWPRGGLAGAKRARATLELLPLLSRRLELAELVLQDARVTAIVNERGETNWEMLTRERPPSPASSFRLSLEKLALERGRVEWFDARSGRYLRVRRVDGRLAIEPEARGRALGAEGRLELTGLGDRRDWPLGAQPIIVELEIAKDRARDAWTIGRIALERGPLRVSGKGRIEGPEQRLTFRLDQTRLPLDAVLALLPRSGGEAFEDLGGTGELQVALEARGPMSGGRTPALRARAVLEEGTLRFGGRGTAFEHVRLDVVATEQGIDVKRLEGRVGRSSASATGMLREWNDPRVRASLRANLDLAEVGAFLPLADSTRLAGRADVALEAAGRLPIEGLRGERARLGRVSWSGRGRVANASASGIGLGVPISNLQAEFGITPERAWFTGLAARVGKSDVAGDGTIDRPDEFVAALFDSSRTRVADGPLRFVLRSRTFDGDELFPARSTPPRWPRVHAEGTVQAGAVRFRKFAGTNFAARVRYDDGALAIDDGAADAYGGRVRGSVRLDVRDPARPAYSVKAAAESLSADQVLSAWTPIKNVAFGTLQLTAQLKGSGTSAAEVTQSLSMTGLAHVLGGRLAGARVLERIAEFTHIDRFRLLSFRDLSAPFSVQNGRVVLDPIAISSNTSEVFARGSIGLDGTLDLRVAALVPASEARALPASVARGAGALVDSTGRLTLDLTVGGTLKQPKIGWDAERTASRLMERLPGTVGGLARRIGVDVSDSLLTSRKAIEHAAEEAIKAQQKKLEEEAERQKEALAKRAAEELAKLFARPATTAPTDTAALDSSFSR